VCAFFSLTEIHKALIVSADFSKTIIPLWIERRLIDCCYTNHLQGPKGLLSTGASSKGWLWDTAGTRPPPPADTPLCRRKQWTAGKLRFHGYRPVCKYTALEWFCTHAKNGFYSSIFADIGS